MAMWIERLRATGKTAGGGDNTLPPAAVVARNWADSAGRDREQRAGPFTRPSWKDVLLDQGSRRAGRLAALGAMLALTGCGGGGNDDGGDNEPPPPPAPAIQQFSADRVRYDVGDVAKLTVRFSGGAGRIEPGIGAVIDGASVDTPPLDVTTEYELIIESAAGSARRKLTLDVGYRGRYRALGQPFAVAYHSAVLAADGTVVIIGGSRGQSAYSESIDRIDPGNGTVTKIGTLAGGPFTGETATRLPDGRILVAGARLLAGVWYGELVNERTGAATPTGPMSTPRMGHAAALLADGRVLLTGGTTTENFPGKVSPTAEIWDPQTGEFRRLDARMQLPRVNHTATALDDGRVLIVGGFSHTEPYVLAELFDPQTEAFSVVPANELTPRGLHEAVKLDGGTVLVMGGEDAATTHQRSVLRWRSATGVFEVMPDLAGSRSVIRSAATRSGEVLLFGGVTPLDPIASGSAETYRPLAGGLALPPMPRARAWHTVTRLADGRVLIVGGEDATGSLVPEMLVYD